MNAVVDWLVSPVARGLKATELFTGFVTRVADAGIPLWRAKTSLRTQHPEVWVKNLEWRRHGEVLVDTRPHGLVQTSTYRNSPAALIIEGTDEIRCPLAGDGADIRFPICADLRAEGATDYVCFALAFAGARTFASFATDRGRGFDDADLAFLRALLPTLSLRLELEASNDARSSLLEVYLGKDAARRVLGGAVRRGDGSSLRAAILMSDLRDFTRISDGARPEDVVVLLDRTFDCVAGAVLDGGGEVLKFIGDAVLAVFHAGDDVSPACRRALLAADDALRRLERWNATRQAGGLPVVGCGLGLHVGDVYYGNIGASARLDFTVIGAAVNETARVESMCKAVGVPLLMSDAFASVVADENVVSVGSHSLKGVSRALELFTLRRLR